MREIAQKFAVPAAVAGGMLILASSCFYTVDPTDVAEVRRLGTVITPQPVGPGLHFKLPLIDRVDHIRVSIDTLPINNLTVYTVDVGRPGHQSDLPHPEIGGVPPAL